MMEKTTLKIIVTGATGLVGSNLSKKLAELGHDVICPVRRMVKIPGCRMILENFEGNILENFNEKVDVFINNIGHISEHLSYKKLKSVNVDLQAELVKSAGRLGVKRYVQVSSVAVMGLEGRDRPITEDDDLGSGLGYGDTKRDGEKLVFETCKKLGIECVALRPTAIYGDTPKEGMADKIGGILKLPIRMIGSGEQIWHMVHVDDVSQSCLLAGTKPGVDGMIFNIAGPDPMKADEVVKIACSAMNVSTKGMKVPVCLAMFAANLNTFFAFGKKPMISKFAISLLSRSHEYDIKKAQELLGFEPKKFLSEELPNLLRRGK